MNSRFLLLPLAILIILPFFASSGIYAVPPDVVDELGIMGIHKTEAEGVIKNLEDTRNVSIRVYLSSETFDEEDFYSIGNYTYYYEYNLDERGNPFYNVLIFYAKVNENYRLGYFHSSTCEPFVEFLETLKQGDVGQGLSGGELLTIIEKISQGIKDIMEEYGEDCKVPSEEPEEIEKIEVTTGKTVFLIDDTNWKDVLSLYPLTTYHYIPEKLEPILKNEEQRMQARKNKVMYNPTLVYHREGEEVDLESTLIFLKQFRPDKVVLVGNEKVSRKLKLALEEYETREIKSDEYKKLWEKKGYEYVVVSEGDYKTGLLASVFASYLNAPLLFSVSESVYDYDFEGKKVYYVGEITGNTNFYIEGEKPSKITKYTLEELQKRYHEITNTDKVILVNTDDIKDKYCEEFEYFNEYGVLTKAYCKDSLTAPLLATLKNELIVFTEVEPLGEGVKKIPDVYDDFYVDKDENVYYLLGDWFAKANFQRNEINYYKTEERLLKFSISPGGDIYVAGEKNVYKLDNDRLKKLYSVEEVYRNIIQETGFNISDFEFIFRETDFAVDDDGNSYFLYLKIYLMDRSKKILKITKYNKRGIIYDKTLVSSPEQLRDFLKNFAMEKFPEKQDFQNFDDASLNNFELKVTSEGIYIIFVLGKEGSAREILVYEFKEMYEDQKTWLNDENAYKIYFFDKPVGLHVQMDSDKNLYVISSSGFAIIDYPTDNYMLYDELEDFHFYWKVILNFKFSFIFPGKENVYATIREEPVILVFEKSDLVGTLYMDIRKEDNLLKEMKMLNGRYDCYFYDWFFKYKQIQVNPEKAKFEEDIVKKSKIVKFGLDEQTENFEINYLTVLSSPNFIPMSKYRSCSSSNINAVIYESFRENLDNYYSNDNAAGRIFAVSVSDTSSYLNRIISFSKSGLSYIPDNDNMKVLKKVYLLAYDFPKKQKYIRSLSNKLTENGYRVLCFVGNKLLEGDTCVYGYLKEGYKLLSSNDIILYDDHGNTDSWKGDMESYNIPEIYSPIAIAAACSTMDYYESENDELFGTNFIRKGGLGYYGAVSVTFYSLMGLELTSKIFEGYDLGNAFRSASKTEGLQEIRHNYILLGDPTIKPALLKEVKLEYEPEKPEGKDHECYPMNGRTVCERVTKTAEVEICGKKEEREVVTEDYGIETANHLYTSVWEHFTSGEREALSIYGYLTSNSLPLGEAYDDDYNLYYQCPSYACDKKYCECYNDQAKCREKYKETAKKLLGIPTSPIEPEPEEEEECPGEIKKGIHICKGDSGKCECRPCENPKKGGMVGLKYIRCGEQKFSRKRSNDEPFFDYVFLAKNGEYICITECCIETRECIVSEGKQVEFNADMIYDKVE